MHNAQIWKSIEALCNEAETVSKSGVPIVAIIKSTPPPITSQRFNSPKLTTIVTQNEPVILTANLAPPSVVLEVLSEVSDHDQTVANANSPLTPATMADIAAAVEQISKAPKNQKAVFKGQSTIDDARQQMMGEISEVIRTTLADDLAKLVRQAVSASIYELLASTPPTQTLAREKLEALKQKAVTVNENAPEKEKKSLPRKTISKKPPVKTPPVTKVGLTTPAAKNSTSKNATKKHQ